MNTNDWTGFQRNDSRVVKPFHRIDFDLTSEEMFGTDLKSIECQTLWKPYITEL